MNTRIHVFVSAILILCSIDVVAQTQVSRTSGGSVRTDLGYGIAVNKDSSLDREWITIHDSSLPVQVSGTIGVKTGREDRNYVYTAAYTVAATEAISAIEVRFLTFDVWGNHVRTLSATDVVDIAAGSSKGFNAKWREFSENRIAEFYASISYIAQVRTSSGRVLKTNPEAVLTEAKKFSEKFSMSDLEPSPEKD